MHVPMSYCHTRLSHPSRKPAVGIGGDGGGGGGHGGGGGGGGDGGGSAAPDVQRCRSGIGDALRGLQTRAIKSWMDNFRDAYESLNLPTLYTKAKRIGCGKGRLPSSHRPMIFGAMSKVER